MTARVRVLVSALLLLCLAARGAAQSDDRLDLARELASLMLDDNIRRGLDEEIATILLRAITSSLQERLHRNLQESEVRGVASIVERFIRQTRPSSRAEEVAARVYASHFDGAELQELLRFQKSEVGRKAARLTPVIGSETARALYTEMWESPAMPELLSDLQREFPVLRSSESP